MTLDGFITLDGVEYHYTADVTVHAGIDDEHGFYWGIFYVDSLVFPDTVDVDTLTLMAYVDSGGYTQPVADAQLLARTAEHVRQRALEEWDGE